MPSAETFAVGYEISVMHVAFTAAGLRTKTWSRYLLHHRHPLKHPICRMLNGNPGEAQRFRHEKRNSHTGRHKSSCIVFHNTTTHFQTILLIRTALDSVRRSRIRSLNRSNGSSNSPLHADSRISRSLSTVITYISNTFDAAPS